MARFVVSREDQLINIDRLTMVALRQDKEKQEYFWAFNFTNNFVAWSERFPNKPSAYQFLNRLLADAIQPRKKNPMRKK